MKHVLVTGGCGFIGSNFVRHVLQNYPDFQVVNLDKLTYAGNPGNLTDIEKHPRYRFVKEDVCDNEQVRKIFCRGANRYGCSFCGRISRGPQHHGACGIRPNQHFRNVQFAGSSPRGLAERSQGKYRDRAVFCMSAPMKFTGLWGKPALLRKPRLTIPRSPYSASKASSDHLVSAYFHTYGLPTLITNCSNNYGPYQFPEKLIPLVINNALQGKSLPVYGDGKNVRDWLYVIDHCDAILTVFTKGQNW